MFLPHDVRYVAMSSEVQPFSCDAERRMPYELDWLLDPNSEMVRLPARFWGSARPQRRVGAAVIVAFL